MNHIADAHTERALRRVRTLASLLDDQFVIPGTHLRFGLDFLVGLVPGIGDTAMFFVQVYLLFEAWRAGAGYALLLRMLLNIVVDTVVGTVPVLGDLFDWWFKASRRNARLLERALGGD